MVDLIYHQSTSQLVCRKFFMLGIIITLVNETHNLRLLVWYYVLEKQGDNIANLGRKWPAIIIIPDIFIYIYALMICTFKVNWA